MRKLMIYALAIGMIGCGQPRYRQNHYKSSTIIRPALQQGAARQHHCLDDLIAREGERAMVVDKSRNLLMLMEYCSIGWGVLNQYPAALGKNPGDKFSEGDQRTPEGNYLIVKKLNTSGDACQGERMAGLSYASDACEHGGAPGRYALLLDYPNALDRRLGKTGSGIMIHSLNNAADAGKNITGGCIALRAKDMDSIYPLVSVGTRVLIHSTIQSR